ncbi:hypothetical protein Tco_0457768 [Tanacetum coccineum]
MHINNDVCSHQFRPRSSLIDDVCSHQFRPRSSSIDDVCSHQFRPHSSSIDDVCSHQFRPRSSSLRRLLQSFQASMLHDRDVCSHQFKPRSSSIDDVCSHQFRPRFSSIDDAPFLKEKKGVLLQGGFIFEEVILLFIVDQFLINMDSYEWFLDSFLFSVASMYRWAVPQLLSKPNVPPTKNDRDTLFCPMFDEYFNPSPSVAQPILEVTILVLKESIFRMVIPTTCIQYNQPQLSCIEKCLAPEDLEEERINSLPHF